MADLTSTVGSAGYGVRLVDISAGGGTYAPAAVPYRAAQRGVLQASGAQTATGSSAAVAALSALSLANATSLQLFLEVTAVSGTSPTLNVFLDVSDDGGTTWFQGPQLGPANIAAVPATPSPSTYMLTLGLGATSGEFGDTVRVRWVITGTTPSFTFAVKGIAR